MTVSRPTITMRTKQIVYSLATEDPYVGFEHLDENNLPLGWRYDIKRWASPFDMRLPYLPRLADASTQGVKESEYFLSGVGDVDSGDLFIRGIFPVSENNEEHWFPEVSSGLYFRYKTPFYYYSDFGYIQTVDPSENRDGRNYLLLDHEPDQVSPITAATYIRDQLTGNAVYHTKVNQVSYFSGEYEDGEEKETVTSVGNINWDNVNFDKKEFIVDSTTEGQTGLLFNRDFTKTYGVVPSYPSPDPRGYSDLAAGEILGVSNGTVNQSYYLRHFPVLRDTSFHIYIVDVETQSWEEWERIDSWFDLYTNPSDYKANKFYLDRDLGIVYFSSRKQGNQPSLGKYIVAVYTTTLRAEYEEEGRDKTIQAINADTNPVSQFTNQGFVCITHDQLEAASIVLNIDKPAIPLTANPREYGPIYCGSDYALLKATVTSASTTPVPGVEVGFEMMPTTIGFFDGSTSAVSVTNSIGEAFTSYQPPVSAENFGYYVTNKTVGTPITQVRASTHLSYDPSLYNEIIIPSTDTGFVGKEEDIYLYQVLKDDLLLGYDSVEEYLQSIYYQGNAPSWVVDADDFARWKTEISLEYNLVDWDQANSEIVDGKIAGRKVVIYQTDTTDSAVIPETGTATRPALVDNGLSPGTMTTVPAVIPVRPKFVDEIDGVGTRLIYENGALPLPDLTDSGNPIGGYWVVATRRVRFRAHCYSPRYNNIIYSNEIVAKISLPDYLLGEHINDLLKKVPYGWRLFTSDNIRAAGLDGATFLTINPHSGPYKIVDTITQSEYGTWASAPFKSVVFQFYGNFPEEE